MLERAIVSGEYAPGEKLNEVEIATKLNVSRGPVREAFRALEQAGLLRNEKNRGVTVRVVPLREAEEIYEVRAMLDESVARALAKRISPDTLKVLKGIIQSMKDAAKTHDVTRYTELNVQFHDAMVVGVGNTHLTDTYRRLVRQLGLLRQAAIEAEEDAIAVSRPSTTRSCRRSRAATRRGRGARASTCRTASSGCAAPMSRPAGDGQGGAGEAGA